MKFDTVIIGGGLAGLSAGLALQKHKIDSAIVSAGQSALYFFSGSFESMQEPPQAMAEIFREAGISLHYQSGWRLMPMGKFESAACSIDDVSLLPSPKIGRKALIVSFVGYYDFYTGFLAEGLEKQGVQCRIQMLDLQKLSAQQQSPHEMRTMQIARTMDRIWESVVREIRVVMSDEDVVVLPQVFGLKDTSVPGRIREGIPAQVVFVGTFPPSVAGIRTHMQLKRRYETLGGTFLAGDSAVQAHVHDGIVHSVATQNLGSHFLEARHFILASGAYFSKGLKSTPEKIYEPVFGLDVVQGAQRSDWYNPSFSGEQPYLGYGVATDEALHPLRGGKPLQNLFATGAILGATRPELGSGGGLAVRSALLAAEEIIKSR